jgi:alkylation response protein AidB-like acyl-CoA dehydrogenase
MNFDLSEDQIGVRDAVREFADAEIAPHVATWEKEERFPREILSRLGELGIMGMMVPEEFGGAGADALSYVLAIEELARVSASTAVIVSVNNSVVCYPIWKFGSAPQKTTVLRELASGRALGAYALTEPQSGSDAANQKTRAVRDGSGYVLNGAKAWITNAGEADWYVVMARTRVCASALPRTRWACAPRRRRRSTSTISGSRRTGGSAPRGRASRSR